MAEQTYPYSTVPNRLRELLQKTPSLGKPTPASTKWLKGLGFTGGNDASILATMRRVGIIDSGGNTTPFYDAIRNRDGAKVADYVQKAYKPLFDIYPDAYRQDDEALRNFFRSNTTAGDKAQSFMVRTFKVLAEFGEWSGTTTTATTVPTPDGNGKADKEETTKGDRKRLVREPAAGGLTLNVNIQLQLPPSADGQVYDKLFEAMGKHLKGLASFE